MPDIDPTVYVTAASNGGITSELLAAYPDLTMPVRTLIVQNLIRADLRWAAEAFVEIDRAVAVHDASRAKLVRDTWTQPIKPSPTNLPAAYWEMRPELELIREAAWSARVSPDALLGAVLARTAWLVHPRIRLPALVGAEGYGGTLDLIVSLIGPSGAGKSTAMDTAERLIPYPPTPQHFIRNLGSGEGVVEQYHGWVDKVVEDPKDPTKTKTVKVKEQTRFHGMFTMDEGQALKELGNRAGSTLWPTFRTAWTGGPLGGANADKERDRQLAPRSYRFVLVAAFQPEYASAVLDDMAGGSPQRFLWLDALDPSAPDVRPPWPGELYGLDIDGTDQFTVAPEIRAEVDAARVPVLRGLSSADPLDSHRGLLRLKLAALHAVLDDRRNITWEDWGLAQTVLAASDAVRTGISAHAAAARARFLADSVDVHAQKAVAARTAVEDAAYRAALEGAARAVGRHVHRQACEDGCTSRCVARAAASQHRKILAEHGGDMAAAIDLAVARGWIRPDLTPGPSLPA